MFYRLRSIHVETKEVRYSPPMSKEDVSDLFCHAALILFFSKDPYAYEIRIIEIEENTIDPVYADVIIDFCAERKKRMAG